MLILILASCLENGVPNPPVEVRFQLLNSSGEPTIVFQQGEDILFDYRVMNNTDKSIFWQMENLNYYDSLFTVFHVFYNGEIEIGQPHKNSKISWDSKPGIEIKPQGENIIRMTWQGDWHKSIMWNIPMGDFYHDGGIMPFEYLSNSPLPKGKYFVEFEHVVTFAEYDPIYKKFKINFKVR